MGRRRRKEGFDLVELTKLILLLLALLWFFGTQSSKGGGAAAGIFLGALQSAMSPLLGVVMICGILAVVLLVILCAKSLFSKKSDTSSYRKPSPVTIPASVHEDAEPIYEETFFSRELLDSLEWRRFEILVTSYFRIKGYDASRSRAGADGGVDIVVRKETATGSEYAYVQCKAWKAYTVGVKPIRELFGVMAADGVPKGYFVSTGGFTSEAQDFASYKPLTLVTGWILLEKLNDLKAEQRRELYQEATSGDYTTPTCPSCDVKMTLRNGKNGEFWGCRSYPKCRQTFAIS